MTARRVAFVVRASRGGMSRHVLDLVTRLPRDRYEPAAVLAPEDQHMRAGLAALGVEFVPVPMADRVDPLADVSTVRELRRELDRIAPDLVHMHSNKAALLGMRALRHATPTPASVFTAHNVPSFEKASRLRRALGRRALAGIGRSVDRTIAVSFALATLLIEDAGFDAGRVDVVHNGVDADAIAAAVAGADRVALRAAQHIPAEAFVLGTLGRLVPDKGVDVLLRAAASLVDRHPELRVVIAGDGPDEKRLRTLAGDLGISHRVLFAGFVEDPCPWLSMMDVFVLPTRLEAFGLAALEAMAAGLPVVASDVGGVPEVVSDDVNGMLVPPGDAAALADTIGWLIIDSEPRERLSAQAPVTAREHFSLTRMAEETAAVYDAAIRA